MTVCRLENREVLARWLSSQERTNCGGKVRRETRSHSQEFTCLGAEYPQAGGDQNDISVGVTQVPEVPRLLDLELSGIERAHVVVDLGEHEARVEVRVRDLELDLTDHPVRVVGIAEDDRILGECERL